MATACDVFCNVACSIPIGVARTACAVAPGSASCIAATATENSCETGCHASCGLVGTIDPPLPIAFYAQPCCGPNLLNRGWLAVGRAFPNPLLALEYQ
jgi:hypothetical protein